MSNKPKARFQENALSSDKPIADPNNDVLGYSDFAKYLASAIAELTPEDGIVLGIYAPWGSGKTTLLNFVQHYLAENDKATVPIVVPFNPWWFSGQEDLVLSFFQQLLSVLNKDNRIGKKTRKAVERYADVVGQGIGAAASLTGATHGVPMPGIGTFLSSSLKSFAPNEKPINDLKADVENALKKSDTKLLIIIDDIDRLTAEEIRQLFRVVKAVADFPNVIYLLTFDRVVVAKALETVQEGNGNNYLEKIIQVPFELPFPDRTAIGRMLFQRLDVILGSDSGEKENPIFSALFSIEYWNDIYRYGVACFLNTPRDVVRLANTLSVTYSSVRNEVNPVDFIAIECLRVFAPAVYDVIQRRPEMFVGAGSVPDYEKKQYKKFHEEWFDKLEPSSQEAVKYIVSHLFPRTNGAWHDKWISADDASSWGSRRRIAHSSIFPIFFRLTIPTGEISNLKMYEAIECAKDTVDFTKMLLDFQKTLQPNGSSYARQFLERLQDYTQKLIPDALVASVLKSVVDAGDLLITNEPQVKQSMFDFGIVRTVQRIIYQLLERLSQDSRFDVFYNIIATTNSYYVITQSLLAYGQQHGKFGGTETPYSQTFSSKHLEDLEQVILKKLRDTIQIEHFESGGLFLRQLLFVWKESSGEEEVKQWLIGVADTEDGLYKMLAAFLSSDGRLDPFWFKPYLEPSSLQARVKNLSNLEALPPRQRLAILEFLQECADRNAGLNPEDVLYFPGRTVFDQMKVDRSSLVNEVQNL